EIRINNRKILAALAEICGGADQLVNITTAIDKLDKIGIEKVKEELAARGLEKEQIHIIEKYLLIKGTNGEKLSSLVTLLGNHEIGNEGINEIKYILHHSSFIKHPSSLIVDLTLARGLNYY
ncbi:hypothetical protein, partial [Pseudomonas aeruginosa]